MKKSLVFLMAFAMITTITGCGSASSSNESDSTEEAVVLSEQTTIAETEAEQTIKEKSSNSEYNVEILSNEIKKDSNGNFILVVEYNFTNNSEESKAFVYACSDKVYQNGIECNTAYFVDGIDTSGMSNEVQSGCSISFKTAYELQNVDTPVEIKVSKFLSRDTVYLDENIDLTEAKNAFSQYEAENPGTSFKVVSTSISKDFEDKPVLVVEYEYYNGENEAKSFMWACNDKVFQNGIECNSTVIGCDEIDSSLQRNDIMPKTTLTLKVGYILADTSSPVNVILYDRYGKNELLNQTIDIQ